MKKQLSTKNFKLSTNAGFTLVETLVAVSVLLLAMTGPMTIAQQGLSSSISAPEDITARYLGQEALEQIRAVRDENVLTKRDWLATLDECISSRCIVDSPNESINTCDGSCEPLRIHESSGLYGHNTSWSETMYTRSFIMERVDDKEARIEIRVTWTPKQREKELIIVENLLNWQ